MRIGMRAHDLGKQDLESLARNINKKGFSCIQFALKKALIESETQDLCNAEFAKKAYNTLKEQGIQVSVLGCYINIADSRLEERRQQLELFKRHLRHLNDFGGTLVGTESFCSNQDENALDNDSEEALAIVIESLKELVQEAEKYNAILGIEGVARHIINTPQKMKIVLDEIRSDALQVIFDPTNLMSATNYIHQDKIIQDSFDLFSDKMRILHAKDFIIDNGEMKTVPAGKGLLNYDLVFSNLKKHNLDMDILIEDIAPDDMGDAKEFILGKCKQYNV